MQTLLCYSTLGRYPGNVYAILRCTSPDVMGHPATAAGLTMESAIYCAFGHMRPISQPC